MTYYDGGANVGFFTIFAARLVGSTSRGTAALRRPGDVYAFDHLPSNLVALRRNAALNRFTHVEAIETALGPRPGAATLNLSTESSLAHLSDYLSGGLVTKQHEVRVTSLESEVLQGRTPPDLIKLDAKGTEIGALQEAADLLDWCGSAVICEHHHTQREFVDFLPDRASSVSYLTSGGPVPRSAQHTQAVAIPTAPDQSRRSISHRGRDHTIPRR